MHRKLQINFALNILIFIKDNVKEFKKPRKDRNGRQ